MNGEKILESSPGLFGKISICETVNPAIRLMKINDEIEGQAFSIPNATDFSCTLDGPGPVSASRYLYGFIIAAWLFPDKKALVLGLGAGIGVTLLLTLFPKLTLTVVEIDAQVIRLAKRYFPLIAFYEAQGRLQIIESAAEIYLENCDDFFAFTLLDLFSGDEKNHHNLQLIDKALERSPYFMANIITSEKVLPVIERAINVNELMWLRAYPSNMAERINWIMTNLNAIPPKIQEYTLFSDMESAENIMLANEYFNYILSQVNAACFYR
ncbi:MAG: hypothetical protein V4496_02925 [Pseudomonadota bacterium]